MTQQLSSTGAGRNLQLKDVTICAADTVAPALAARALTRSMQHCDFGDAILFSDTPIVGAFRNVRIARMNSLGDYSAFCLRSLPNFITTEFALVVQWDGYVTNRRAWASGFRKCDYIGAPIYKGGEPPVVGNGGFSLRSRKLLDALQKLPPVANINEDWVISSIFRRQLERDYGIRFAPLALAERFSYELRPLDRPTFGFHAASNLWREETEAELIDMFKDVSGPLLRSRPFLRLIESAFSNQRRDLAAWLYGLLRAEQTSDAALAAMSASMPVDIARSTAAALEQSLATGPRRVTEPKGLAVR